MTFLEQELHKIFEKDMGLSDMRIVGDACYGRLTEDIRVKINFTTCGTKGWYEALKVTLINPSQGPIDSILLRFRDLSGFKKTLTPSRTDPCVHIWTYKGKMEWFGYQPDNDDYGELAKSVSDYLDVFREPVQEPQMGQTMG